MATTFALFTFACSPVQTSTPQQDSSPSLLTNTPEPSVEIPDRSPVPFHLYGQTLIDVPYCASEGMSQTMDVFFPAAGGPWPALVYVHGGSWMYGDKSEAGMFAHRMTADGYLVVSVNYRLYPAGRFPDMIEDVKCAIRSLRAHADQLNLDPDRIAAAGSSAGGHLVSLLGTTDASVGWDVGEYPDQSSRVQAVIAIAAVTDLTQNFPNADIEAMRLVGFSEENISQASPVAHVTPDDPPFLLIHGDRDTVVPYEQSQLMYGRLLDMNVPTQLVIVHNAGHAPIEADGAAEPGLEQIYQIISDFLAKYLPQ